jgi:anhydro-N-acetylmuramic acid kinase
MYDSGFNVLGLMSGTSLDGMDAALVTFNPDDSREWKLLGVQFFEYPNELKELAHETYKQGKKSAVFDKAFAKWTIACVRSFSSGHKFQIDLLGLHGQTIFHDPANKFTYQAGCLPKIATELHIPLVTNFRMQDVLLGGQGAPLVPMGDHLMFGEYECCLNIGGFANFSLGKPLLSAGVAEAGDICPVNTVLNKQAEFLGQAYDAGGEFAASGTVHEDKVQMLNEVISSTAKSLGYEWMEKHINPILEGLTPVDALATYTEASARSIAQRIGSRKTLVTGGGAKNKHLINRISSFGAYLVVPNEEIIDYKEAMIFAMLAAERFGGRPNVLGHSTKSGLSHSSGSIFYP